MDKNKLIHITQMQYALRNGTHYSEHDLEQLREIMYEVQEMYLELKRRRDEGKQ